jgi:putative membrane-bound dehydrogenase-like protein
LGPVTVALLSLLTAHGLQAQVTPEESAKQLKPAEGLQATLWAAEPMVVNPTTIDIDSRGRVWVTEGLNYRLTRGGNRQFHRIEDADKIKILEDTDGDGKADKMTVFADKVFPVPMGIAIEEHWDKDGKYKGCRVFVGNSPDLLVLEDTDGDDKADKRYPLLSGFGGIDSDHGVHGPFLFLDGKIYFTHGDGCCSVQPDKTERGQNFDVVDKSGRHVSSSELANTLRANRDGTQFEVIADRQRNNYETTLNSFGNEFTSDNDDDGNRGSRVIWVMDGGKYGYRTPGSPRHWGEDIPGMVPKLVGTGNGSPCGLMVYEGSLLPKEYQGAVLEAEAGPRVINYFPLTRHGAAFRTEHKIMLGSDDPWFRPVDVTAAPDGSVFVADWYDGGVGGHAFRDQSTGRIFRVAPKGADSKRVTEDFSTIAGLITALKSPNVATVDVARRVLIERGQSEADGKSSAETPTAQALKSLAGKGDPVIRARAIWVLSALVGKPALKEALADSEPRIREVAVRILGRDVSRNGKVEYSNPDAKTELAAQAHLNVLLPLANDPDAGVRRELILALRDLPTSEVGEALKTLAAKWDGRDRWYLEALGLALRNREPEYVSSLFDGSLYGPIDLELNGAQANVALPPYFPVDRNEAYLLPDEESPPANALTKTIGLSWQIHRAEVLPLLARLMPGLQTADLQQAADDVIAQVTDPAGAAVIAEMAMNTKDQVRKRQALATLGRKLDGAWRDARNDQKVVAAIESALNDPATRAQGITTAAASGDGRYATALEEYAADANAPEEVRVAAVEAFGRVRPQDAQAKLDAFITAAIDKKASNAVAEAAIRTLPRLGDSRDKLAGLLSSADVPLGLRREALRSLTQQDGGGDRVLQMARENKLPEDLKTEATVVLNASNDRRLRDEASKILPLPRTKSGKPLPPLGEIIRRDGDAARGQAVFFRATADTGTLACSACHRVQGRGQWIGPDLSTIGSKYGKDELLRSILNPSAAIGYNYRTAVLATTTGQILSGLPVEDTADHVTLKTAEGKRVVVPRSEIDERSVSEISLMPEGLAETMGEQDVVDLLAFLTTLKQPVSIVGQAQVLGPVVESGKTLAIDPTAKIDLKAAPKAPNGNSLTWRRLIANAEGSIDLSSLAANDSEKAVYLFTPVNSPVDQSATLVLDTKADVKAWLGGKPLDLPSPKGDEPRSVDVHLGKGSSELVLRIPGSADSSVVATFIAGQPLEFSASEAAK